MGDEIKFTYGMIGQSQGMNEVYRRILMAAPTNATVLILGETGTGKEMVAYAIHRESNRKTGNFCAINCGALPETLLESELFGYEKGAFTDAHRTTPGFFETASDGTLFLDEINGTSPKFQLELLRTLQGKEFYRVGSRKAVRTNARVIAASSVDLDKARHEGKFSPPLFYRLNIVSISLPPLRHRAEDIPDLANHFCDIFAREYGKQITLSEDAIAFLQSYHWPGNVRELEGLIERGVVLFNYSGSSDAVMNRAYLESLNSLSLEYLSVDYLDKIAAGCETIEDVRRAQREIERRVFSDRVRRFRGNKTLAARSLGIDRKTLQTRLPE
jgi:DNA-binding NtrC family response regulator